MAKIKVEVEVPKEYCNEFPYCSECYRTLLGDWFCRRFSADCGELEFDKNTHLVKRCDECKQAEVEE